MKLLTIGVFLFAVVLTSPVMAQGTSPCSASTAIFALNWKNPTLTEVGEYLCSFLFYPDAQSKFPGLTNSAELIQEDVNGDNQPDLIVSDYLYVSVMLWMPEHNQYTLSYENYALHSPRNPASKVSFEDWTNDGMPEVIFDSRWAVSGTDIGRDHWLKSIIHCESVACNLAWSGEVADYFYVASSQDGISLWRSDLKLISEPDSNLILLKTTHEFAANCPYCSLNNDPVQSYKDRTFSIRIGDTVQTHFQWNGKTFEQVEENVLQQRHLIEPQSNLEARGSSGQQASISVEKVGTRNSYEGQRDSCQLTIDGDNVGESFLCLPDYTHVEWIDINQDGQDELVVTALASGLDSDKFSSFHRCVYQRLLVYQLSQKDYEQIADVSGCMVSEDFFGVRLEDVDNDNQPEIVSAGELTTDLSDDCFGGFCWYELRKQNDIYKWDGHQFAYWKTIPRSGYGTSNWFLAFLS